MKRGGSMIFIGADHAGFQTKEYIKKFLEKKNIQLKDLSPISDNNDDYPDHANKVAKEIVKNRNNKGILIGGTGTGMVIAANKVKGIRAALVYDIYTVLKSREDNDTNIITLRGRNFSREKAKQLVNIWLRTPFNKKQKNIRRINKINRIR